MSNEDRPDAHRPIRSTGRALFAILLLFTLLPVLAFCEATR